MLTERYNHSTGKHEWVSGAMKEGTKIEGEIIRVQNETEHYRIMYVLTKKTDGEIKLYAFTNDRYYDLTEACASYLKETTLIVPFFSPADES